MAFAARAPIIAFVETSAPVSSGPWRVQTGRRPAVRIFRVLKRLQRTRAELIPSLPPPTLRSPAALWCATRCVLLLWIAVLDAPGQRPSSRTARESRRTGLQTALALQLEAPRRGLSHAGSLALRASYRGRACACARRLNARVHARETTARHHQMLRPRDEIDSPARGSL
jgi:hypothetical protein